MLGDDDPFAVPLFHNAGPAGVLPRGGFALEGVDVVEDAIKPGDLAAAGERDLQVLQLMTDVLEVRAHPERDALLDVFEALDDPRARRWQPVDLLAHHNASLDAPHHIHPGKGYPGTGAYDPAQHGDQTTAYMDMLELAPNRLLIAYDRVPNGWNPVPLGSDERNRIYLLTVDIARG